MTNEIHPYEMHPPGGGGFTCFDAGDLVALPLIHLNKATLRGTSGQRIALEFGTVSAVVEGDGMTELFGHLLNGQVKTLRRGQRGNCVIRAIQVIDT